MGFVIWRLSMGTDTMFYMLKMSSKLNIIRTVFSLDSFNCCYISKFPPRSQCLREELPWGPVSFLNPLITWSGSDTFHNTENQPHLRSKWMLNDFFLPDPDLINKQTPEMLWPGCMKEPCCFLHQIISYFHKRGQRSGWSTAPYFWKSPELFAQILDFPLIFKIASLFPDAKPFPEEIFFPVTCLSCLLKLSLPSYHAVAINQKSAVRREVI